MIRTKIYILVRCLWRKAHSLFKNKFKTSGVTISDTIKWTSERIVEYPFIFKNLGSKPKRILDVGCTGSYLITQLAALGHTVYGIDLRWYPVRYPNVKFVQGDIRNTDFPNAFFDIIIAVSTLEHVGIKEPQGGLEDPEGDQKAIKEMIRILKPNGKMLVTLPYGKCDTKNTKFRVYNAKTLIDLLTDLNIEQIEYYSRKEVYWLSTTKSEAEIIDNSEIANAVVLLELSKKTN